MRRNIEISKQSCRCARSVRSSRIVTGKVDLKDEIFDNLIDDAPASTDISKQKDTRLGCDRGEEAAVTVLAEIAQKLGLNSF